MIPDPVLVRKNNLKGFLYALTGFFLISTNFITAKYGLGGFDPITFSLVWTAAATLHALVIILAGKKTRQIRLPPVDLKRVCAIGVLTGFGMLWGWTALSLLDPSFMAFLNRFIPVLTIILGVLLLREKLQPREIWAIAIMLAGGLFSTLGSWRAVSLGILFALLNIIAISFQLLLVKTKVITVHPTVLVLYRSALACAVIFTWGLLRGLNFRVEPRYWMVTVLGALLGPCLGHILIFQSFRYWELSRTSMISTIEPLFVLPLAYLFLGTLPDKMQFAGGMIILAGALWLFLLHRNGRIPAV